MTNIAFYAVLKKIPDLSDNEAKEAVADITSSKSVATKMDIVRVESSIAGLKTEVKYMRWMLGLIFVMNVAILIKLFFSFYFRAQNFD